MSRLRNIDEEWIPKTRLGELVQQGLMTLDKIFQNNLVVKEKEIINILLPQLREDVVTIKMIQKMTASGQRSRFKAVVIVGADSFLGVGASKSKEVGPAIRKAIDKAKLSVVPILRGCGSKECGCGGTHSIPFKIKGKCGSVRIQLIPAPVGVGLACADKVKQVLRLCGIEDVWSKTFGDTRTSENLVKATFDALKKAHKFNFNI
ncbi:MAG: 30S ribosomal protein S5 [Promethearchaeota archaeon]|nr:30S ribosomal protein S5 [Candidatus Lokiarchaeota archaeon]MCK4480546.1 30S ribosomal protein S5 [Candidatus Lokiarchaeota archaeon]MCK4778845.1 30S ribosomal protein S5 [Candidatus Lokiarchaeota archaeon]TET61516.1 MAG: 30S ribosomal protein S5 [Candidatus Lokiarchaeota archaeon]TKJ20893.1 MAG: 30S ribosomal protein S5 [Candidatus Lokiarchaeota archaeon Loki_b32]